MPASYCPGWLDKLVARLCSTHRDVIHRLHLAAACALALLAYSAIWVHARHPPPLREAARGNAHCRSALSFGSKLARTEEMVEGLKGGGGGAYDVWSRLGAPADDDPAHAPGPSWATASCSDIIKLVQEVRNVCVLSVLQHKCWSLELGVVKLVR